MNIKKQNLEALNLNDIFAGIETELRDNGSFSVLEVDMADEYYCSSSYTDDKPFSCVYPKVTVKHLDQIRNSDEVIQQIQDTAKDDPESISLDLEDYGGDNHNFTLLLFDPFGNLLGLTQFGLSSCDEDDDAYDFGLIHVDLRRVYVFPQYRGRGLSYAISVATAAIVSPYVDATIAFYSGKNMEEVVVVCEADFASEEGESQYYKTFGRITVFAELTGCDYDIAVDVVAEAGF